MNILYWALEDRLLSSPLAAVRLSTTMDAGEGQNGATWWKAERRLSGETTRDS